MVAPRSGRRSRSTAFTLVELLVVITIIGILMSLLLPAVQGARESARKTECQTHLKNLSLGVLEHEAAKRYLPSAGWGYLWTGDADRGSGIKQPGGWFYSILPYIEQPALAQIGAGLSTTGGASSPKSAATMQLVTSVVAIFHCPSRRPMQLYPTTYPQYNCATVSNVAKVDYAGNGGDNDIIDADLDGGQPTTFPEGDTLSYWAGDPSQTGVCVFHSELALARVTDGLSNTYLIGEKYIEPDNYFNGTDPGDNQNVYTGMNYDNIRTTAIASDTSGYYPPLQDTPGMLNYFCFGSAHSGIFSMVFCDGSIHSVSYSIDPETHRRLGNRADGLPVDPTKF